MLGTPVEKGFFSFGLNCFGSGPLSAKSGVTPEQYAPPRPARWWDRRGTDLSGLLLLREKQHQLN